MTISTGLNLFLYRLKKNYKLKKIVFCEQKNKKIIPLLKILNINKFIKGFSIKNNKIYIFLNYKINKPTLSFLKIFSKDGFKRFITYKNILSLSWKYKHIIFLISSSKGLVSNKKIFKKKLGGILLAKCL